MFSVFYFTTIHFGRKTTTEYDVNSNVLKFTDAAGNVVEYAYDDFGNMLTLTDPMGRAYEFTYDKKKWGRRPILLR